MRAPLPILALCAALASAQSPGDAIRERASKDAAILCPQRALGGDDESKLAPDETEWLELKIEAEGCERMTGYVSVPKAIPPGKKAAVFFMFHGNGDVGKHRVRHHAQITSAQDPVIVLGVQYQELEADSKGRMGLPTLAEPDGILKGSRWLLDKVLKEWPADPDRVFVGGFSWGAAWATGWCNKEWKDNRDAFPFRACFLYSSGGAGTRESLPPIPIICICGEEETALFGSINVVEAVRNYANVIAAWGLPVQYHEIPNMGHIVNNRCLQITRDIVNDLGGPGALPYPSASAARPDPLPFPASADPFVKEIAALLDQDRWLDAVARLAEIEADRKIALKDKRAALALRTEMQKFAQAELTRLGRLLAEAAETEAVPNPFQVRRQRGLLEAYAKWPWAQKTSFAEAVAKLDSPEYGPTKREREREQAMRDAWARETREGKRAEAKAAYEALAARRDEDGGASVWPRAAAWRLKWWMDLRR